MLPTIIAHESIPLCQFILILPHPALSFKCKGSLLRGTSQGVDLIPDP